MDSDSFAKWVPVALQFAKCFQGGTNTDDVRTIIKEEMSRSENQENNETMRQMLTMIEQKHAAELHEASRERDMFKVQAELLSKQLQDLQKSKRTEDKNERMMALLNKFSQLNTNVQPNPSSNDRKDQRRPNTKKFPQKGWNAILRSISSSFSSRKYVLNCHAYSFHSAYQEGWSFGSL